MPSAQTESDKGGKTMTACLVCGGPKQHKALVICDACDSIVTDPENKVAWHEYRYKEVRPQWFKSIRATGSIV